MENQETDTEKDEIDGERDETATAEKFKTVNPAETVIAYLRGLYLTDRYLYVNNGVHKIIWPLGEIGYVTVKSRRHIIDKTNADRSVPIALLIVAVCLIAGGICSAVGGILVFGLILLFFSLLLLFTKSAQPPTRFELWSHDIRFLISTGDKISLRIEGSKDKDECDAFIRKVMLAKDALLKKVDGEKSGNTH